MLTSCGACSSLSANGAPAASKCTAEVTPFRPRMSALAAFRPASPFCLGSATSRKLAAACLAAPDRALRKYFVSEAVDRQRPRVEEKRFHTKLPPSSQG